MGERDRNVAAMRKESEKRTELQKDHYKAQRQQWEKTSRQGMQSPQQANSRGWSPEATKLMAIIAGIVVAGVVGFTLIRIFLPLIIIVVILALVLLVVRAVLKQKNQIAPLPPVSNNWSASENGQQQTRGAWYPDPSGQAQLRWWDGVRWTEHVSN